MSGALCIAGILQVFPSWSLERQAGENEKRKKAGGGHYFLMRFLTSSPFVLRAGTEETGREGPGGGESGRTNVGDFLQIELLCGVCELCILVICLVH